MEAPPRTATAPVLLKRIFILMSMSCYLVFCHLMILKLNALEAYYHSVGKLDTGRVLSPRSTDVRINRCGLCGESCAGECGPPWAVVFAPLWAADAFNVLMHAAFCRMQLAWTPTTLLHNARIEHIIGLSRSLLYAAFKVLVLKQLEIQRYSPVSDSVEGIDQDDAYYSSWFVVFSPTYAAALLQMGLHLHKRLEPSQSNRSRSAPRRPGFSISLLDLLALNVSCELEGVFYIPNASWASVLWPLWIAAAIGAIAIFLGLCFAIPLLRRRMPTSQLPFVLPPLILLVAAYIFALQGLTALTGWLDGNKAISVAQIVVPITSAVWSLTLLLSVVAVSSLCHPTALGQPDQQEQPRQGMLSLDANLLPRLLVMESSTLFRQVSERTLQRYNRMNDGGSSVGDEEDDLEAGTSGEGGVGGAEMQPDAKRRSFETIEPDAEANQCWVCFEGPAEAVLLQCGHAGLCLECAENLWRTRASCPMCRQTIELIARLGDTMTVDGKVVVAPSLPTSSADSKQSKR